MFTSFHTRGRLIVSLAFAALVAAGPTFAAEGGSQGARMSMGDWIDEVAVLSAPDRAHGILSAPCTESYPMHHRTPCGTATGGPSGGLH